MSSATFFIKSKKVMLDHDHHYPTPYVAVLYWKSDVEVWAYVHRYIL